MEKPLTQLTTLSPRQAEVLAIARQTGRVSVDDLVERYSVSPQTIRKDLNELCDRNLLQRVHGGAIATSGVENVEYEARRLLADAEKRDIGRLAANLIPNGSSLLINIGTTTEQVAMALRAKQELLVITNNMNVVNILVDRHDIEIIIAGGVVRHTDAGVVGEATVDFIKQFLVDFAIIGASAIAPDGSLLDYDYREVKVTQAIIENARKSVLVADAMKFERTAPVRIGHLSQLDAIVTDEPLSDVLTEVCAEHDVAVHITSVSEGVDQNV